MPAWTQHDLEFLAVMNTFYHQRTEKLFTDLADGSACLQITLLMVAAGASVLSPGSVTTALILTAIGLTGVTLGARIPSKRAIHRDFKGKWGALLADVKTSPEEDLAALSARVHALNQEEPPPNRKRLDWAYEAACRSLGLEPVVTEPPDEGLEAHGGR